MPPMDISAVVITLNEEANIEDCLASVSWAREIVVVDAQSTDRTRDIALRFTREVHERKWEGYSEAKAFAISKAGSEWVLSLDADERVTPELRKEIESLPGHPEFDGYMVPIMPLDKTLRMVSGLQAPAVQERQGRSDRKESARGDKSHR